MATFAGRLVGKSAIVTAAAAVSRGAGMGRTIAELFGEHGAMVTAVDLSDAAEGTAERIRAAGGKAVSAVADVTQRAGAEKAVAAAMEAFGRVDILVNVVGGAFGETRVDYLDVDDALWQRIIDINLKTTHLCTQLVLPIMVKQGGGSLIHISSTNALMGCPTLATYSAAKAGLAGYSRVLATRFGADQIRSNVICPGLMGDGTPDKRQPLGRTCVARDIANAALFLASDDSSFVTAQVLAVDGGHTTTYPETF